MRAFFRWPRLSGAGGGWGRLAAWLPVLVAVPLLFLAGQRLIPFFSPGPVQRIALGMPAPAADAGRVASLHWFGEKAEAGAETTAAASTMKLIGVYASGSAASDFALIERDGTVLPWRVGQERDGMTLLEVHPTAVVLRQGGGDVSLALARPSGSAQGVQPVPAQTAPAVVPLPSAAVEASAAVPATESLSNPGTRRPGADAD